MEIIIPLPEVSLINFVQVSWGVKKHDPDLKSIAFFKCVCMTEINRFSLS